MANNLEIKMYRAILHIGGKTLDQIANEFDGPKPTIKELQNWKAAYDLIDGIELVVTDGFGDGYSVIV